MQSDTERARLGYRGNAASRAKNVLAKTFAVLVGGVALASAFVMSLVFFAVLLAVALVVVGYLWWKTRKLRKHMREHILSQTRARDSSVSPQGEVIEDVVISRSEARNQGERPN